ncbi:hypothetical protein HNQ88_004709 [Aureibacter tunicatorum]|nr:hypothetical protein [Aureibacter tunicatorum]BDD07156.1 hypothetical protein AUTU_46390 [Aureibacter tunicatorum]
MKKNKDRILVIKLGLFFLLCLAFIPLSKYLTQYVDNK